MKKVLVFGAAGFIGNALLRELIRCGMEVTAVVPERNINETAAEMVRDAGARIVECNLQDVKGNLGKRVTWDIDTCYFLAWDGLSNDGLNDYSRQINNVVYMLDLMVEVHKLGCKKFIGSGSITQQELATEEGRAYLTDKHKYYRTAQQACEEMGKCLALELNMIFIWPLITNIYGEGEKSPRFINTMLRKLLDGEDVPTSEGKQLYDFVYISDAVKAFIKMGEHGKSSRKYIVGSGHPMQLREFLQIVEKTVCKGGKIKYGRFSYSGVYFTDKEYDIRELEEDTGYHIEVDFETGVRNTADWIERCGGCNG